MIIAWLGLIFIGVLLIRNFTKGKPNTYKILKERFAKGEIDKEEFERIKSVQKD
ncbi:SHOCT domain-containing protein [Oceanobacillus alkalisoli]|uniref:SHOCT domain-containing protein n=1 Tax=Oceanobacillus alkalisoli TaxID=2925113 RepID=UPI001EEFCD4C|nr:SHOCT domain-containing protein [Oceanobacillus alkalisoli]MCF3942281.1 SHOCT domain-containing protein [Oceanobacillus alkalisoli]MCG5104517.1 SHOCT domain-containing protein [Oceanobacillus alkalisoli]